MKKILTMAAACVLLLATATAQEAPPNAPDAITQSDEATKGGGTGLRAGDSDAMGWVWYKPRQSWSYVNSASQQRLWMDFTNSSATIETSALNAQANMIDAAAASEHWIAFYWTSDTTWSSSRLWYY